MNIQIHSDGLLTCCTFNLEMNEGKRIGRLHENILTPDGLRKLVLHKLWLWSHVMNFLWHHHKKVNLGAYF